MTTRSDIKTVITSRLRDDDLVYWTSGELDVFITEALHTLNALGMTHKQDILVSAVENQVFYDLLTDATTETQSHIAPSVTAQDLLTAINHQLIESVTEATPSGKSFTLADFYASLNNRLAQFCEKTRVKQEVITYDVAQSIQTLPSTTLEVIAVLYRTRDNNGNLSTRYALHRASERDAQSYSQTPALPRFFANTLRSDKLAIFPPPQDNGQLQCVVVRTSDPITSLSDIVPIPNSLTPHLRYGIMADLLSKPTEAGDITRVNYCHQRFEEGLVIGANYASVVQVAANNVYVQTTSLQDLMSFSTSFANSPKAVARILGLSGYHIFALDQPATSEPQQWTLTAISNVPADDNITLDSSLVSPLINYIYHTLQFKCGTAKLAETQETFSSFIDAALRYNMRLNQRTKDYITSLSLRNNQNQELPHARTETVTA